ncbi:hypothetical protein AB9W56_003355 [Vibrio vulnificus]
MLSLGITASLPVLSLGITASLSVLLSVLLYVVVGCGSAFSNVTSGVRG